jgi:hypothetical protein
MTLNRPTAWQRGHRSGSITIAAHFYVKASATNTNKKHAHAKHKQQTQECEWFVRTPRKYHKRLHANPEAKRNSSKR